MKILFASAEAYPFSKTGGLADMAYFLPKAIKNKGHDIKIITPYYRDLANHHDKMTELTRFSVKLGGIETIVILFGLVHENIDYIFVQNMHYFERDLLYGYSDDAERFACFSYAILESMRKINFYPDILHINDWQTGMVPFLLDTHYRHQNENYFKIHTLYSIHNLEYQGVFDPFVSRFFNVEFDYTYMHFDRVNFMKAAIERATMINTVSPTYRNEVMTSEFGFTLDGALKKREKDFVGILNGIDTELYNPNTDDLIYEKYNGVTFKKGKAENKKQLLQRFNLTYDENIPLVSYIGRLATQKGINLMSKVLEEVIQYTDAKFVFLGSGNDSYEEFFRYLANKYPDRVAAYIGFSEELAHKLYAATDIFMMPSRFEPCGLGQMIAMRYGALPLVRETGGLKDTVEPYNKYTDEGTGFTFANYDSYEFKEKLFEAIKLFEDNPKVWNILTRQALKKDYSLDRMALEYEEVYKKILGE